MSDDTKQPIERPDDKPQPAQWPGEKPLQPGEYPDEDGGKIKVPLVR